jgi:hypothetical protein
MSDGEERGMSAPSTPFPSLQPARSRRAALTAFAALAGAAGLPKAATATTTPAHPDVELIADCAELVRLEASLWDMLDGPNAIMDEEAAEAAGDAIDARIHHHGDRICAAVPTTLDGHAARARALRALKSGALADFTRYTTLDAKLLTALLRDLTGAAL